MIKLHLINSGPIVHLFLGLYWDPSKEVIVICTSHPEVLDELDGMAPFLISMAPEKLSNFRQVDSVLYKVIYKVYFYFCIAPAPLTHLIEVCSHKEVLKRSLKLNPHLSFKGCNASWLEREKFFVCISE